MKDSLEMALQECSRLQGRICVSNIVSQTGEINNPIQLLCKLSQKSWYYRVFLKKGNRSSKVSYFSNTHIHIINLKWYLRVTLQLSIDTLLHHHCQASLSYALLKVTGTKPTFFQVFENQKLELSMPHCFHLLYELLKVLRMSGFCPCLFKYQPLRQIHLSSRPNPQVAPWLKKVSIASKVKTTFNLHNVTERRMLVPLS